MRIVQVANFYHPRSGGLRTALDALAAGYLTQGHDAMLLVPGERTTWNEVDGRVVVTVAAPRLPRSGGYRIVLDARAVASVLAELAPDVIELSDRTTLARIVTNHAERPPVVLFSHERLDLLAALHSPLPRTASTLTGRWTRRLLRRVDAVVCASDYAAAELLGAGAGTIDRVPLGVDLDVFSPRAGDGAEPVPPRRPGVARAVHVGRLAVEKRPADALDAIAALRADGRHIELIVAGDGPERAALERAAPPGTAFVGHLRDRRQVAALLAHADVAICPGPKETFGLAALEALACGTPVACVGSGALREVVPAAAGAVAAPRPDGLARATADVLARDQGALAAAARMHAERYSWERCATTMLDIHHRVAARRPRGAGAISAGERVSA